MYWMEPDAVELLSIQVTKYEYYSLGPGTAVVFTAFPPLLVPINY